MEKAMTIESFIKDCLNKWKWFATSVTVVLLLAIAYLIVTPPKYTKSAQVLVKDDSAMGALMGQLGGLADLGGLIGFGGSSNVYNELYAMQSPWLILNVVNQLHLDITYTIKGIRNKELYGEELPINVAFKNITDEDDVTMKLDLTKSGNVKIYKIKKNNDKYSDELTGKVGQTLKSSIGDIEITPTPFLSKMQDDEVTITVKRIEPMAMVELLNKKRLTIAVNNREASIIDIKCKDVSRQRASDLINAVIAEYKKESREDKDAELDVSERYVVERLASLESELKTIGQRVADYKGKTMMPDIEVMAKVYAESSKDISEALLELNNQLYIAQSIRDYLKDETRKGELLPALLLTDNKGGLGDQIESYNTLQLQRNKLAASSSNESPLVKDIDKQLASMHSAVLASAENAIKQLKLQIKSVSTKDKEGKQLLSSAPKKYIEGLTDEEDLKVLSQVRIFLLQKREEAQMSKALRTDVRLLSPPLGIKEQSSPSKMVIIICAFMLGLFIPASSIVIQDYLKRK